MAENTVVQLKAFFSTPEKKLSAKEMADFWNSLSEEDKRYYKNADISE